MASQNVLMASQNVLMATTERPHGQPEHPQGQPEHPHGQPERPHSQPERPQSQPEHPHGQPEDMAVGALTSLDRLQTTLDVHRLELCSNPETDKKRVQVLVPAAHLFPPPQPESIRIKKPDPPPLVPHIAQRPTTELPDV